MRFRSPVRLEKWIAYDGALGADVLALALEIQPGNDAGGGDDAVSPEVGFGEVDMSIPEFGGDNAAVVVVVGDGDNEDGQDDRFTVSHDLGGWSGGGQSHDGRITVSLPDGVAIGSVPGYDYFFPYLNYNSKNGIYSSEMVNCPSGYDIDARDVYIEISNPFEGSFGFFSYDDLTALKNNEGAAKQLADAMGLGDGESLMVLIEGENGTAFLREFTFTEGSGFQLAAGGAEVEVALKDGGVQFHVLDSGDAGEFGGDAVLDMVFRSITFTADSDSRPLSVTGFQVDVRYKSDWDGDSLAEIQNEIAEERDGIVHDMAGSTSKPPDNSGGGPDPEPPPGPRPPPEPPYDGGQEVEPTDPDPNPVVPGDNPGGDDGLGEGTDEGGEGGESGSGDGDGADTGDSAGDSGLVGDEPGYIFQVDDDAAGEGDDGDASAAADNRENGGGAAPVIEPRAGGDGAPETAAEAEQFLLTRDMEFMLTAVRNDKEVLLGLIGRLQQEYLLRDPEDFGELRGYLRRLFDMGRQEEGAVNRILDAMNQEMQVFRATDVAQRDGMLIESVRELIDSAERHSGEMGAYSRAIEAVADLLARRREDGLPPPSDAEAAALFAEEYGEALAGWREAADRIDPMGRELTAAQRVAGI